MMSFSSSARSNMHERQSIGQKMSPDISQDIYKDELLRLFNGLSEALLILDAQQHISRANQAWHKLGGYQLDACAQRLFSDFVHPEDRANWHTLIKHLNHEHGEVMCLRLLHADQGLRWCEASIQSLQPDSTYPLAVTLRDITEQVRSDQAKAASFRSLDSLVNRLPAMLYRARNNASWSMEYVSQGCLFITGYSSEVLLNQAQTSLGAMILKEDAQKVWDAVQDAIRLKRSFDLSYRIRQKSGEVIKVRDTGHILFSDSGVVLGLEGLIVRQN